MKLSNYFFLAIMFSLFIFSCGKEEIEIESPTVETENEPINKFPELTHDDLAFKNAICLNGGEVLTVVKRGNSDLDFFNKENFRVIWTINNHQIVSNTASIDCLCGTMIHVSVTDLRNYSTATLSYNLMPCDEGDLDNS